MDFELVASVGVVPPAAVAASSGWNLALVLLEMMRQMKTMQLVDLERPWLMMMVLVMLAVGSSWLSLLRDYCRSLLFVVVMSLGSLFAMIYY